MSPIEKFKPKTPEKEEQDESPHFRLPNAEDRMQDLRERGLEQEANDLKAVIIPLAEKIAEAGGEAFLVGGSVRDEVMELPPKDYDIEVHGIEADELNGILKGFGKVNEIGVSFGIINVVLEGVEIDVSLPRRDSTTGAGHKDFSVGTDPFMKKREAARRRDFTINSMMKNILTGETYDFFGGKQDIEEPTLRVVDQETFVEDPLRVLRGVRFVGRFGLAIDDETAAMMRDMRSSLKDLPKERLKKEWTRVFLESPKPSQALGAAMQMKIFHEMHPDVVKMPGTLQDPEHHPEGDAWAHTLMVVDEAAKIVTEEALDTKDALVLMLTALCHDFGKPDTTKEETIDGKTRITAHRHEKVGVPIAKRFLSEIGVQDKDIVKKVATLTLYHMRPSQYQKSADEIRDGTIRSMVNELFKNGGVTVEDLARVAAADSRGRKRTPEQKNQECPGEWLIKRVKRINLETKLTRPMEKILSGKYINSFYRPNNQTKEYRGSKTFGDINKYGEDMHKKGYSETEVKKCYKACVERAREITGEENPPLEKVYDLLKTSVEKAREMTGEENPPLEKVHEILKEAT